MPKKKLQEKPLEKPIEQPVEPQPQENPFKLIADSLKESAQAIQDLNNNQQALVQQIQTMNQEIQEIKASKSLQPQGGGLTQLINHIPKILDLLTGGKEESNQDILFSKKFRPKYEKLVDHQLEIQNKMLDLDVDKKIAEIGKLTKSEDTWSFSD